MNKLMPYEKKWIARRLRVYRIKYAEIYNEVYDHIVSACEDKRKDGDRRDILPLFQETMDRDIGSHAGIAQMTSERAYTLKTTLRSSLMVELKTYLNSVKLVIPFGIACLVYSGAVLVNLNTNWLVVLSILITFLPNLYLLVVGTKNGYLRTFRSRRKTALVNHLMFKMANTTVMGFHCGFFGISSLSALAPIGLTGSNTAERLIGFLGYPGFAFIIAIATIYVLAFVKVARTDYRQLIQQVV